jgi:hypothetical protein
MFGLDLDAWNTVMVSSLGVAAIAAVLVGISTAIIIKLQKQAELESNERIASLVVQGDQLRKDTAEANARAMEARVELEKFKAPRSIPAEAMPRLVALLSAFAGTNVAIYIMGESPEPNALAGIVDGLLKQANWVSQSWNWSGVGASAGIIVLYKDGTAGQVGAACEALVAALTSVNLSAGTQQWPGDWDHFGGMLNGPNSPSPTAAPIRIVIGTKPQ